MNNNNKLTHLLGNKCYFNKDYEKALTYYLQITNYNKQYIIYSNIAACYLWLQKYTLALDYSLKSVELNLNYCIGWGRVGSSYKGLNLLKESYKSYKFASNINPKYIKYMDELNFTNIEESDNINNKIYNIIKNDEIKEKLKNSNLKNIILNIKNPNDIFKNQDLMNLLNHIMSKI